MRAVVVRGVGEVGLEHVIHALARLVRPTVRPTERLGIAGVFLPHDARPTSELEARGDLAIPWPELFRKDITIGMGRDHDTRYNVLQRAAARPDQRRAHHTERRRLAPAAARGCARGVPPVRSARRRLPQDRPRPSRRCIPPALGPHPGTS